MGTAIPQVITNRSGSQVFDGSLKFIRFDDDNNTYLERTFIHGNSKKWTWSAWIKRDDIASTNRIFGGNTGNTTDADYTTVMFNDSLRIGAYSVIVRTSDALFRDAQGWYNVVVHVDIDNASSANKYKAWVNGEELTWSSSNDQTNTGLNRDGFVAYLGTEVNGVGGADNNGFGGKMAQVYFVDGQSLDESYFGFTDPLTNTWKPKKYITTNTPTTVSWTGLPSGYSALDAAQYSGTLSNILTDDGNFITAAVNNIDFDMGETVTASGKLIIARFTSYADDAHSADYRIQTSNNSDFSSILENSVTLESENTSDFKKIFFEPTQNFRYIRFNYTGGNRVANLYLLNITGKSKVFQDFGVNGFYLPFDGSAPIGQDKSGRGNNWTPKIFGGSVALDSPLVSGARPILNTTQGGTQAGVGVRTDTIATSINNGTTWSNSPTVSGGSLSDATDGFDGDLSSSNAHCTLTATSSSAAANVTFTASIPNVTKVEVFAHSPSGSGDTRGTCLDTDGVTHTSATITGGSQSFHTIYEGDPITLANVGWGINQNSATGTSSDAFRAFRVNGYILKDSTTSGEGLVVAMPLVGITTDVSNLINSGSTAKTVTQTGSAADIAASTEQNNFYASSAKFAGNVARLEISGGGGTDGDYDFGTGDFTMECWFYATATANTNNRLFCSRGDRTNYQLMIGSNKYLQFDIGGTNYTSANNVFVLNKWHHFAVTRDGLTLRLFVDGIIVKEQASVTADLDETTGIDIGYESGHSSYINGYMQDARVYKGVAKYTSDFIPASTNPDILLDTPSGVSGSSKLTKITDGAVAFDGGGDSLTVADSTDFDHQSTFTWECFVYLHAYDSSGAMIIDQGDGSSYGVELMIDTSGNIRFYQNNSTVLVGPSGGFTLKRWHHIAVSHDGSKIRLFLNGVKIGENTTSSVPANVNVPLNIGKWSGNTSYEVNGFISNLRFVNGTALYTSDFTPSTAPLTNVTNTKLLCCQSNSEGPQKTAVIPSVTGTATAMWPLDSDINDDSGNSNTLTENGGGTSFTSAGTNPFGLSNCADFAEDGKYLSYAVTPASAWTIDGYIKFDDVSSGSNSYVLGWNGTDGSDTTIGLTKSNSTFTVWGSSNLSTTTVAETGRWYHVRLTTNSASDLALYVDGVLAARSTSSDGGPASPITIGDIQSGRFNGQIAGVRYTPTDLGAPPLGGENTSSGVTSNSPSVGVSLAGNVEATNFNPFITDINTVRGQETGYATWNPLCKGSSVTLSNGNLTATKSGSGYYSVVTTMTTPTTGKWYYEVESNVSGNNLVIGIAREDFNQDSTLVRFLDHDPLGYIYRASDGYKSNNNSDSSYGDSYTAGDSVGIALDLDAGDLTFYKNGISQGVAFSSLSGRYFFGLAIANGYEATANFGQKPFKFPPPDGFQPLNFANTRPVKVFSRPDQYVGITTWKGNATSGRLITGLNFNDKPDLIWIKNRGEAVDHTLFDSIRGFGANKELTPNDTYTQGQTGVGKPNSDAWGYVNSNNLNGFTVNNGSSGQSLVNNNNIDYVAWCWKAGGNKNTFNIDDVGYASASDAGLSAGTITPLGASVGTKQGFSIVKFHGNETGGATVPHGLSQTPDFTIVKQLTGTEESWRVKHKDITSTKTLYLNQSREELSNTEYISGADSTTITLSTGLAGINADADYLMLAWHSVPGLQKFGKYEGTGDTNGPYVELGFRPAVVIIKDIDNNGEEWVIYDNQRGPENPNGATIYANNSNAEYDGNAESGANSRNIDFLSNGFKLHDSGNPVNKDAATHVYAAWAEAPSVDLYGGGANAR